jgi:hypothetical protein
MKKFLTFTIIIGIFKLNLISQPKLFKIPELTDFYGYQNLGLDSLKYLDTIYNNSWSESLYNFLINKLQIVEIDSSTEYLYNNLLEIRSMCNFWSINDSEYSKLIKELYLYTNMKLIYLSHGNLEKLLFIKNTLNQGERIFPFLFFEIEEAGGGSYLEGIHGKNNYPLKSRQSQMK